MSACLSILYGETFGYSKKKIEFITKISRTWSLLHDREYDSLTMMDSRGEQDSHQDFNFKLHCEYSCLIYTAKVIQMAGEQSQVAGMNVFQFHSVIHVNPRKSLKNPWKSKESQYKFQNSWKPSKSNYENRRKSS